MDFTGVVERVNGLRVGIRRTVIVPWGTGLMNEAYVVYPFDEGFPAESVAALGFLRSDTLWTARSYHLEWAGPGAPDVYGRVAGCLFVADDTLLAYGVVLDSTAQAHSFAESEGMLAKIGYYRFFSEDRRFLKVANVALDFVATCRSRLKLEQRAP